MCEYEEVERNKKLKKNQFVCPGALMDIARLDFSLFSALTTISQNLYSED